MNIKDRAAKALDESLIPAMQEANMDVKKIRGALVAFCDGSTKIKSSTVRLYCKYLEQLTTPA